MKILKKGDFFEQTMIFCQMVSFEYFLKDYNSCKEIITVSKNIITVFLKMNITVFRGIVKEI